MAGDHRDQTASVGAGLGLGQGRSPVSVREMGHLDELHVARTSNELSATSREKSKARPATFLSIWHGRCSQGSKKIGI